MESALAAFDEARKTSPKTGKKYFTHTLFHANVNELETLYNEVLYVNISFNT